eukprot:GILK01006654.1.p1 GENE.GILK01006654.1~~GILK01006654.1.p1  ORF type:complete len:1082 (+),score=190.54 GILK01006654.1:102-3347(+)
MSKLESQTEDDLVNQGTITSDQVQEIRRVFNLVDRDGSGSLSLNELAELMKTLTKRDPSPAECAALLKQIDADGNGSIEWHEFLEAMTQWLNDTGGLKRKRADIASPETRRKLHKSLASFFLQFQTSENFNEIQKKLLEDDDASGHESWDYTGEPRVYTSEEKWAKFAEVEALTKSFAETVAGINSNEPAAALTATQRINSMFAILDMFKNPRERFEISALLIRLFDSLVGTGVMARITNFLAANDHPHLQWEAVKAVTYFAPGPNIANTPRQSHLHPDKMFHKSLIIHFGALPKLVDLVSHPCIEVREQAVLALGFIARNSVEARDLVLSHNVVEALISQISDQQTIPMLRRLSWTLSVLCGSTLAKKASVPASLLASARAPLAGLLFWRDDDVILANTLTVLSFLLPGVLIDDGNRRVWERLVELLRHPSVEVQRSALQTLRTIMWSDEQQCRILQEFNLLSTLRQLLQDANSNVRMDACDLLTVLAKRGFVKKMIDEKLIPILLQLIWEDSRVRWKAVKVIRYTVQTSPEFIPELAELGIVKALFNCLSYFKEYDNILADVYHYLGPSFNFTFLQDALATLCTIVKKGDAAEQGRPHAANLYASLFDRDCLERFRLTLQILIDELKKGVLDQSGSESSETMQQLEESIISTLQAIRKGHQSLNSEVSQAMIAEIDAIGSEFETNLQTTYKSRHVMNLDDNITEQAKANAMIEVRCYEASKYPNGDNRVLEVPRGVSLLQLRMLVEERYQVAPLTLQYHDERNEVVTIDHEFIFEKVRLRALRETQPMRLLVFNPAGSNIAAPVANPMVAASGALSNPNFTTEREKLMFALQVDSRFTMDQLTEIYNKFRHVTQNTGGRVNKEQFFNVLRDMGINDRATVEEAFSAFDMTKDGVIDFREFVVGLSVLHHGSMDERLQLAFKAYDLDGNGAIDKKELFHLLKVSMETKGVSLPDHMIANMVEQTFAMADLNRDNSLSYAEFRQAVIAQHIPLNPFWTNAGSASLRQAAHYMERQKTTNNVPCATCGRATFLPFLDPRKPVYCQDCYRKRRQAQGPQQSFQLRQRANALQPLHSGGGPRFF